MVAAPSRLSRALGMSRVSPCGRLAGCQATSLLPPNPLPSLSCPVPTHLHPELPFDPGWAWGPLILQAKPSASRDGSTWG